MAFTSSPPPPQPLLPPLTSLPPLPRLPLPVGYRFCPTDYEILNHYLKPKMNGSLDCLAYPNNISEVDIYGDHPSKIFALVGAEGEEVDDDEDINRYFFTPLKKTTEKGSRISRRVGNFGTWKAENSKEIFMPKAKILIGYNKYFKYVPEKHGDEKEAEVIEWLMHEYSLLENQEIVICRITKKVNKKALASNKNGAKKRALEPFQESGFDHVIQVQEPEAKRACLQHPSMIQVTARVDDHELQQQPSSSDNQRKVSKSGSEAIKNTSSDSYGEFFDSSYDLLDVDKSFDEKVSTQQQYIHESGSDSFDNPTTDSYGDLLDPSWDLFDVEKLFDENSCNEQQHIHGSESEPTSVSSVGSYYEDPLACLLCVD